MISTKLHSFIDHVIDNKKITIEDMALLINDILIDGVASRQEADALIALDRIVDVPETWGDYIVPVIVDYVVWESRPTGYVPADVCHWLINSLEVGELTETAARIAGEVVREAQSVDVALVDFVLHKVRRLTSTRRGCLAA